MEGQNEKVDGLSKESTRSNEDGVSNTKEHKENMIMELVTQAIMTEDPIEL